jgi:hypothetical protein
MLSYDSENNGSHDQFGDEILPALQNRTADIAGTHYYFIKSRAKHVIPLLPVNVERYESLLN